MHNTAAHLTTTSLSLVDLRNFISLLLTEQPAKRLSVSEIFVHNWMIGIALKASSPSKQGAKFTPENCGIQLPTHYRLAKKLQKPAHVLPPSCIQAVGDTESSRPFLSKLTQRLASKAITRQTASE